MRYRRLGLLSIYGGHPEIVDDLQQRIATFAQSPALVRLQVISLVSIVPQIHRKNFESALQWYHRDAASWKETLRARIEQAKMEQYKEPKSVHIFSTTSYGWYTAMSSPQPRGWCH